MNSYITIQVRVAARQAQGALKGVEGDVVRLQGAASRSGSALSNLAYAIRPNQLQRFGQQLQYTGRALMRNFTYPLAIAGGAALKFELDNERAMTGVRKVYGDGSKVFNRLRQTEIPALGRAFEALSNEFGVNRAEVIKIGAAWAQAGSSGLALAKSTKLTLETMILGEMDATEATNALIAIQAQYGQNTRQLSKDIDILNMVENQTGITMQGLVQGFQRAAGTARSAGVDVQHLAAFLAALTPAAGTAAQAGNALKTILSRLMAPTKEAAQVLGLMHIQTKSLSWQMLNGTQRIELMSRKFHNLSDSQKLVVSTTVASRYQINRFDVAMRDVYSKTGYYARALNATGNALANFRQRQYELNQVLTSNPQRLKQIWVILQNAMADIIQPLIPSILYLAQSVAKAVQWFANLNPAVQKLIGTIALLIAALGPIILYIGAINVLFGSFFKVFSLAGMFVMALAKDLLFLVRIPLAPFGAVLGRLAGIFLQFGVLSGIAVLDTVKYLKFMMIPFKLIPIVARAALAATLGRMFAFRGMVAVFSTQMRVLWTAVGMGVYTIPQAIRLAMVASAGFLRFLAPMFMLSFSGVATAIRAFGAFLLGSFAAMRGFTVVWATQMRVLFTAVGAGIYKIPEAMALGAKSTITYAGRLFMGVFGIFRALPALLGGIFARLGPIIVGVFTRIGPLLLKLFTGPIGWAITAALLLFGLFHRQIVAIWNRVVNTFRSQGSAIMQAFVPIAQFFGRAIDFIQRQFDRLPQGVQSAFMAVVKVVSAAAQEVYKLFSYLNPFAHHSPSLVENTQRGMKVVQGHHKETQQTAADLYGQTSQHIDTFNQKTGNLNTPQKQFADQRSAIKAVDPAALKSFDQLIQDLTKLNGLLAQQKAAVDAQQAVVDRWAGKLKVANDALDKQQAILDTLQKHLDAVQAAMDKHQAALDAFANAPIQGMKKMNDQIFANELAAKKLQLAMMKWQDANGSIDQMQSKLADLRGAIESLRSEQSSLRTAGAGSDVLGAYDQQIAALQDQQTQISATSDEYAQMAAQLDALNNQGQELQLTYDITFDPLTKSVSDLANAEKELPYDQIIAGIKNQQAAMAALQPSLDAATTAVNNQQKAVDKATAARDRIQRRYDRENATLDVLQAKYQKTQDMISQVTDALNQMGSAAQTAHSKAKGAADTLTTGAQNFKDAAGANFPDVGGAGKIGREGGLKDQSAAIDQWTKDEASKLGKAFGKFNLFAPIKDKWNDFKGWWSKTVGPFFGAIKGFFFGRNIASDVADGIKANQHLPATQAKLLATRTMHALRMDGVGAKTSGLFTGMMGEFRKAGGWIKTAVTDVQKAFMPLVHWFERQIRLLWKLFGPDVRRAIDGFVSGFKDMWQQIAPQVAAFGELIKPMSRWFLTLWHIVKPILELLAVLFIGRMKMITSIISNVIGPALHMLARMISGMLQIMRGEIGFVVNLLNGVIDGIKLFFYILTGQWGKAGGALKSIFGDITGMLQGVWNIIDGLWRMIEGDIRGAVQIIWGVIKGFVEGVVGFFQWLYDEIFGHSIVPELVAGIISTFQLLIAVPKWIWDHALKPIYNFFVSLWKDYIKPYISTWLALIQAEWTILWAIGKWVWDNVLKPVYNWFVSLWKDYVKPEIGAWWGLIKAEWGGLKNAATWVWDNVLLPIKNRFSDFWDKHLKPIFTALKTSIGAIWTGIGKAMAAGVNLAIDAVNLLIDGLNAVAKILPGVDWHISHIGHVGGKSGGGGGTTSGGAGGGKKNTSGPGALAVGGMVPPHVTDGARAIIGEGRRSYPEYVIPTDPRFRNRSRALLFSAAHDIASGNPTLALRGGMKHPGGAVPAYGIGGILGGAWDIAKAGAGYVRKAAVMGAFGPLHAAANALISHVPWNVARDVMYGFSDKLYNWLKGESDKLPAIDDSVAPGNVKKYVPDAKYVLNQLHQNISDTLGPTMRRMELESHGDPRIVNKWDSNWQAGTPSVGLMQVVGPTFRSNAGPYLNTGPFLYGTSINPRANIYAGLKHAIGAWGSIQAIDPKVHPGGYEAGGVIPNLANGAYIKARRGGALVRVGEGSNDEIVKPLPRGARDLRGDTHNKEYHFHGDLSFPNIKSPADASEFLKNLESLVRD